jgi:hypothetical protein
LSEHGDSSHDQLKLLKVKLEITCTSIFLWRQPCEFIIPQKGSEKKGQARIDRLCKLSYPIRGNRGRNSAGAQESGLNAINMAKTNWITFKWLAFEKIILVRPTK